MKKYPGGVLSLVIVLNLLRSNEISDYLHELYENVGTHSEINEIILGPLAGYTQSTYGRRLHDPEYFGSYQRKNIEYMRSVLQDIHSLSPFRRFDGINTTIDAWWHTSSITSGIAHSHVDNELETDEDYVSDDSGSPGTASSDSLDDWQSDSDHAVCELESVDFDRPLTQACGEELSREDMDLIDILWRQDIDLGIAKEFYDYDIKKKGNEIAAEQTVLQTLVDDNDLLQTFPVDNETGEYLFSVSPAIRNSPEQQSIPFERQTVEQSDAELDNQLMQLLQLAATESSSAITAEMASYAAQRIASTESLPVNRDDLHMLDDLDFDALLQPASGGHVVERQTSVETQWSQLMALWSNSSASQPQHHQLPVALLRDNVSMTTNNVTLPWLPSELLNSSAQPAHTDVLSGATFTPSVSFTNVTDMWSDSLLTQLLSDSATGMAAGVNDTSAGGTVAARQDVDSSQKFVGMWTGSGMYEAVGEATDGNNDNVPSYSSLPEPHIKQEADDWRLGTGYDNVTHTNSSSGRPSRRSTSSVAMSDDSLDSMMGAQHNHTYTSQVRPAAEPRIAAARMRAAAAAEEEEEADSAMASRDAKRLQELHIPLGYEDIVSTPVEKFNRLLQNHRLSDAQVQFIRDVRRRGKNKMAAQNCRKRKLDAIQNLDGEVVMLQQRRAELQREQAVMVQRMDDVKMKMRELEQTLLRSLHPNDRQVHDHSAFRLQLTADGALYVVPASNSSVTDDAQSNSNSSRKKRGSKKQ